MASEAHWQLGLDEVRLVPAKVPPHRAAPPMFDAETRTRLVEAAIAGHPDFRVWRVELERTGPSYSVDTVRALAQEEPEAALWFILGADQLQAFGRWRDPSGILANARLAVAPRPGLSREAAEAAAGPVVCAAVDWLDMPPIALSATLLRARLRAGQPVRYLVPEAVEAELAALGLEHDAPGPLAC